MDILEIKIAIQNRDETTLRKLLEIHDLRIENGKIIPNNKTETQKMIEFWDQRQQARKILLN